MHHNAGRVVFPDLVGGLQELKGRVIERGLMVGGESSIFEWR